MGGVTATAAIAGTSALMNERQKKRTARRERDMLNQNYQNTVRQRQNLLEQQLSSRRAQLGAMGITGSNSALAAENRHITDTYDDLENEYANYRNKYADSVEKRGGYVRNQVYGFLGQSLNQIK